MYLYIFGVVYCVTVCLFLALHNTRYISYAHGMK